MGDDGDEDEADGEDGGFICQFVPCECCDRVPCFITSVALSLVTLSSSLAPPILDRRSLTLKKLNDPLGTDQRPQQGDSIPWPRASDLATRVTSAFTMQPRRAILQLTLMKIIQGRGIPRGDPLESLLKTWKPEVME